jgi:hypothetical protein
MAISMSSISFLRKGIEVSELPFDWSRWQLYFVDAPLVSAAREMATKEALLRMLFCSTDASLIVQADLPLQRDQCFGPK